MGHETRRTREAKYHCNHKIQLQDISKRSNDEYFASCCSPLDKPNLGKITLMKLYTECQLMICIASTYARQEPNGNAKTDDPGLQKFWIWGTDISPRIIPPGQFTPRQFPLPTRTIPPCTAQIQ